MEPIVSDKTYFSVLRNALDTAKESFQSNNTIYDKVLPESLAAEMELKIRGTVFMIDQVKEKVLAMEYVNPIEAALVNRAIVEYQQKIDLSQAHFIHMNHDLENVSYFKEAIRDIYDVQMQFNNNVFLSVAHKNDLDEVKSRLNTRPRP
jgi:hypothetical protein